jgi:uncharacterized protein (DUF1800 family)
MYGLSRELLIMQQSNVAVLPSAVPEDIEKSAIDGGSGATAALPVAALALGLAACGGDAATPAPAPAPAGGQTSTIVKPQTDAAAARFLVQAQFSASDDEIAALRAQGYEPWLTAQMGQAVSQTGFDWLASRGYNDLTTNRYYQNSTIFDYMIWQQLMASPDGVRKRAALALSEIFVVSLSSLSFDWRSQALAHYWDQLNSNAFGSFRKLLEDVTLNAAMGDFLNTKGNQKEDTRTGRVPDENYAREVMQLFTIGLVELNLDGSAKKDAANQTIPSYSQDDVSNLARVFTGYNWDRTGNVKALVPGTTNTMVSDSKFTKLPMTTDVTKFDPPGTTTRHSALEAKFLGATVPANTEAAAALKIALDTLANHPNVGPFIGKQLIQRLITSNPSPAYVQRVASVFNNNGAGVRGDMAAVFKAILTDEEARSEANLASTSFGKVREPIVRLAQWARSFGASSTSDNWQLTDTSSPGTALGQSPFRAPSVFNFFRPGYVPANTAIASGGLVGPEFQLVSEVSNAGYVNFIASAAGNNLARADIKAAYAKELALVSDASALVDRLSLILTANQLSDATKATIRTAVESIAVTATSTDAVKMNRVGLAVTLVMAAPDYLIQK